MPRFEDQQADRQKQQALDALAMRRGKNKDIVKVDNSKQHAGEPMTFYCTCCNEPIIVPEDYVSKPKDCPACTILKERGWLTA